MYCLTAGLSVQPPGVKPILHSLDSSEETTVRPMWSTIAEPGTSRWIQNGWISATVLITTLKPAWSAKA